MAARIYTSSSAALRLARAREWVDAHAAAEELLLVGGSTHAAAELARGASAQRPATFGHHRLTVRSLALRQAEPELIQRALSPATPLALEALWVRVVHQLGGKRQLGRFQPVADRPGLPAVLARAASELRHARISAAELDADLAALMDAFDAALTESRLADDAQVLELAITALELRTAPLGGLPALFVDVAVRSLLLQRWVAAHAVQSKDLAATAPVGDARSLQNLEAAWAVRSERLVAAQEHPVGRLQERLFRDSASESPPRDDVTVLSAPGEVRECVELARLIHAEAARGVPFDRMAVLMRSPELYRAPVAEALRRAGIPSYASRGARIPDPAGRALLALLACAAQGLSASGFCEYVSLGEVPLQPVDSEAWAPPESEDGKPEPEEEEESEARTLPVPRRWERLLVDAAVIGGRDRWERRLDALARGFERERSAPDVSEANRARLDRNLKDLGALRAFALPLLDALGALPVNAHWSGWLEHLSALASRALNHPERLLALLSELAPMGVVGPVGLGEVRRVLSLRLRELTLPAPSRRYGRVFAGSIDDARGMSFDVVFIPGLAERLFPKRVTEDPVLPDAQRARWGQRLELQADRVAHERLQLQLAVGAAERRAVLSFPRIDAAEGRPRVPSFYALEALRAVEGRLPSYEELSRRAEEAVQARMGWPAPKDPRAAIDAAEWDLSVLDGLFHRAGDDASSIQGRARYLTQANRFLAQSLRARWSRWQKAWTSADGLVNPSETAKSVLARHQLGTRSFSPTALQQFSECPYRFYLHTLLRVSPREEPVTIEELDPLQRGAMVHEVQFAVMTALRKRGALPLGPEGLEEGMALVDRTLAEVGEKYAEMYAPAIDRVWRDELVHISADVREWLRRTVNESASWAPWKFELAFGLQHREQEDPASRPEPAELSQGLRLRGSIDLVERAPDGTLRATDYKTGRQRAREGTVVGGGKMLQPLLYALALEKLFPGTAIAGGRLFYCTQAGGFSEVSFPLTPGSRAAVDAAIGVVRGALERGFFPAAPAKDECTYCDYRTVCGAYDPRRVSRKPQAPLADLDALRSSQ